MNGGAHPSSGRVVLSFLERRLTFVEDGKKDGTAEIQAEMRDKVEAKEKKMVQRIIEEARGDISDADKVILRSADLELFSDAEQREIRAMAKPKEGSEEMGKVEELLRNPKSPDKLREDEYRLLISMPFSAIVKKFKGPEISQFLSYAGNPPERYERRVRGYVLSEFTPDILRKVDPKKVQDKAYGVLEAHQNKQTLQAWEVMQSAKRIEQDGMQAVVQQKEEQLNVLATQEKSEQTYTRVSEEMGKMMSVLQKAGFDKTVVDKAQDAANKELVGLQREKASEKTQLTAARETMYRVVELDIRESLKKASGASREALLQQIIALEKRLKDFAMDPILKDMLGDSMNDPEAQQNLGEAPLALLQITLKRAKHFCEWAESSDTEVLEKISSTDLNKEEKRLIDLLIKKRDAIQDAAPRSRALFDEEVRAMKEAQGKYMAIDHKKDIRTSEALQLVIEAADEVGIDAFALLDIFQRGDVPRGIDYRSVQDFATEHGIPESQAENVVAKLVSAEEILQKPDVALLGRFLEEEGMSAGERQEFLDFYADGNHSVLFDAFLQTGNLQEALLLAATQEVTGETGRLLNDHQEAVAAAEVSKEEVEDMAQNAEKELQTLQVEDVAKTATSTLEELRALQAEMGEEGAEIHDMIRRLEGLEGLTRALSIDPDVLPSADTDWALSGFEQVRELAAFLQLSPDERRMRVQQEAEELQRRDPKMDIAMALSQVFSDYRIYNEKILDLSLEEIRETCTTELEGLRERIQEVRQRRAKGLIVGEFEQGGNVASWTELSEIENAAQKREQEKMSRENLQLLARWAAGDSGAIIDNIYDFLSDLKNMDGTLVLSLVPDNEIPPHEQAVFRHERGGFRILVRQSDWESQRLDDAVFRHEVGHAVDAAKKYASSEELWKALEQEMGTAQFLLFQRAFYDAHMHEGKHAISKENLSKELYAEMFADVVDVFALLRKHGASEDFLHQWRERMQEDARHFDSNGIKTKFFGKAESHGRSAVYNPNLNQKNDPQKNANFRTQASKLVSKIDSLRESGIKGSDALADVFENELNALEDKMTTGLKDEKEEEKEFAIIMKSLGEVEKKAKRELENIAQNEKGDVGYLRELWDNTTFLTLADLGTIWTTTVDFHKRRHERNSKLRAGEVGSAIFDKLYPKLANEFDNKKEEAEVEEVGVFEKGLENKDAWQIMDRLAKTGNKDELKACFKVLAKDGNIDWYDRRIWKAVMRVEPRVRFLESDADNVDTLKIKYQRAFGLLWDNEFFRETDRQNIGGYKSRMGDYEEEAQQNISFLEDNLSSMLEMRAKGEKVEPQRYEKYLRHCIDKGKGNPETVFWFIFQGVHQGLMTMDRFYTFNAEYINNYPPIDWIHGKKPLMSDVRAIAQMFAPENGVYKAPDAFFEWYYTNVMTDEAVRGRTLKSVIQKDWDHDWATNLGSIGNADSAKTMLAMVENEPKMHLTAYPNIAFGQLTYFMFLARGGKDELSEDLLRERIAQQVAYAGTYNAIITGKIRPSGNSQRDYYTINDMGNIPPRGADDDHKITANQYLQHNWEVVRSVDPPLFDIIASNDDDGVKTKKFVAHVQQHYSGVWDREPTNMVDALSSLSGIAEQALKDPAKLQSVLDSAKGKYFEVYPEKKSKGFESMVDYSKARNWEQEARASMKNYPWENRGVFATQ